MKNIVKLVDLVIKYMRKTKIKNRIFIEREIVKEREGKTEVFHNFKIIIYCKNKMYY